VAQGNRLDYAYQIKMKKNVQKTALMEGLQTLRTAKGLSLLLQETTVEI
jgi:hypothetical protein